MATQLKYLSDRALMELKAAIPSNVGRYRDGGFEDIADSPSWDISLGIEYDKDLLDKLDLTKPRNIAAVDLENSKIVGKALAGLTPALANEERIWARLAHVEALHYCRERWLADLDGAELEGSVRTHFFASTQTGVRDDHALSRLWWNYQVARTCQPNDVDGALLLILKSADIRSNFVERIWMTSRRAIASAVLRAMANDPWLTAAEANFRAFMKALNKLGGGIVFEALDDAETDQFVAACVASVNVASTKALTT